MAETTTFNTVASASAWMVRITSKYFKRKLVNKPCPLFKTSSSAQNPFHPLKSGKALDPAPSSPSSLDHEEEEEEEGAIAAAAAAEDMLLLPAAAKPSLAPPSFVHRIHSSMTTVAIKTRMPKKYSLAFCRQIFSRLRLKINSVTMDATR